MLHKTNVLLHNYKTTEYKTDAYFAFLLHEAIVFILQFLKLFLIINNTNYNYFIEKLSHHRCLIVLNIICNLYIIILIILF